ncbi:MAG: DNA polymerase III subunit gamma/tau [Chloroflexi bacterium]|nr:DNA polymerase III subunit gamma/tau [Chloroflexota bacterium]
MSTVFYRKWRPTRFSDVVGQEHITDTLRRAVLSERVAHAYMFTGPRGVGKTSTARILAKALNADLDDHGDPLLDSDAAIAIDEGRYMDLIEIDAASNRGVNDIRDLRERVLLRPTVGEYKVYIIDEVHMLTTEAFNALLKTLEEPPPQVVMILATTDIHRVPATIISRCQRFDFRRLTTDDVIGRLILICDEEEIDCEPAVLELVAQSAWGSLRDAENLLEQLAISYGTGEIRETQARELLGIGDTASARNLASAILCKDTKRALEIIEEEASKGAELKGLRDNTISALRGALLTKHGVASAFGQLGDTPELETEAMNATAEQMLHAITIFGRNERFGEASSPLALEIAALQAVAEPPKPHPTAAPTQQPGRGRQPARQPVTPQEPRRSESSPSQPTDVSTGSQILEQIEKVAGPDIRKVFAQVDFRLQDDGLLRMAPRYQYLAERLRKLWQDESMRTKLRPAIESVFGSVRGVGIAPPDRDSSAPLANANPSPPTTSNERGKDDNQLADAEKPFNVPDEIESHPAVQRFRNVGGRVVGVEDS